MRIRSVIMNATTEPTSYAAAMDAAEVSIRFKVAAAIRAAEQRDDGHAVDCDIRLYPHDVCSCGFEPAD